MDFSVKKEVIKEKVEDGIQLVNEQRNIENKYYQVFQLTLMNKRITSNRGV